MKPLLIIIAILIATLAYGDTYEIYDSESQSYYEINDDGYNSYIYDYQDNTYDYKDISIEKKESLYDKYYDNEKD